MTTTSPSIQDRLRWQRDREIESGLPDVSASRERLYTEAADRIDQLTTALTKYSDHLDGCLIGHRVWVPEYRQYDCTCGLARALLSPQGTVGISNDLMDMAQGTER